MWTTDQILNFAPDSGTANRGKELATLRQWRNLEVSDRAAWGECKSSGVSFYKTFIDLNGPAFKCSCPSRKFPCKHGMGLMFLLQNNLEAFQKASDIPEDVNIWLEKRDSKTSVPQKSEAEQEEDLQKKVALRFKNREKRLTQMVAGLEDLEVWLTDTIREGLAATERHGHDFWHDISARMVDAKLGGLRSKIESMQLLQSGKTDWVEKMLTQLANLYLVGRGFKNLDNLPEPLQEELLSVAGIKIKKEEILQLQGIEDEWQVLGQIEGIEDDRLWFRRVWLKGKQTKKHALLLDFSFGDVGFPNNFITGSSVNGEMVFYPFAYKLRAQLRTPYEINSESKNVLQGFLDFNFFAKEYSKALFSNPWLLDIPACFENVIPLLKKDKLFLIDQNKKQIEVLDRNQLGWKLLALSGGHPISVFGEWTGNIFVPLSAEAEGRLVELV